MNKLAIIATVILLSTGSSFALAQPNQDHTCQGGHNCNTEGGGPQLQSQVSNNETYSTSNSQAESNSASNSESSSNSGSYSNASGGSVRSSNSLSGGWSDASSEASGGEATSDASGGSVAFSNIETKSAASAASVYSQVCQLGGSAQGIVGGFSISNADVLCDHLKVASAMQAAYEYELRTCHCVGICTLEEASVAQECTGNDAMADVYLAAYHDNMSSAVSIMEGTHHVGLMDKIAGALVRPLALLGVLIWLL